VVMMMMMMIIDDDDDNDGYSSWLLWLSCYLPSGDAVAQNMSRGKQANSVVMASTSIQY